jgi:dihydroorotate dehydrogenase electron transfer subunit
MKLETKNSLKGPHLAEILENLRLSVDTWKLVIKNSTIANNAKAGQFVSILCEDLILRRPFSVANAYDDNFEIIYKIKGKGTKFLSSLEKGNFIDVIGPFGNGFNTENKNSLLIGCGVGIAPMLFLSNKLKEAVKHTFIACTQTKLDLPASKNMILITEDGSSGLKGRLDEHLEQIIVDTKPEKIYTCGPNGAMAYICKIAEKYNIPVEAALEREFACGTGVCMGCVVQIKQNETAMNKRICKDGPVFNGAEVIWQ